MPRRSWAPGERLYRALIIILIPLRAWVRLDVRGVDLLSAPGGVLVVSNHDSAVDPLALGEACMRAHRPLRFLTRASLWRWWPVRVLLNGLRQIPVRRGAGDFAAIETAANALLVGEAVCVFPEGTISGGKQLRAHRGVARLAAAVPNARIVLAAVSGGTVLVRFPRRPRIVVELFEPRNGQATSDEDQAEFAGRLLREIRERVPPVAAGRHDSAASRRPIVD